MNPVLSSKPSMSSASRLRRQELRFSRPILQPRLELLEGLARGERAVLEGRTYSQSEVREKMSKWLK